MSATIVVGWDASPGARAALAAAIPLASGGRVIAVHADEPAAPHVTARWQELLQEDAEERSDTLLHEAGESIAVAVADVTIELRSVHGQPLPALLRMAAEVDADAIAVGTRGIGGSIAPVGSVALGLVRAAEWPVLVVPPHAEQR